MQRHGCCVVQRCLDSAPKKYRDMMLDAIVNSAVMLIRDPFGNYVFQMLLQVCSEEQRAQIVGVGRGCDSAGRGARFSHRRVAEYPRNALRAEPRPGSVAERLRRSTARRPT